MASDDRVLFTINQRMNILKDLETFSVRDVAKKYKAHRSTIWRIQKNAKTIIDFANKGKLDKKRKSTRKPLCEELEQRLYEWFIEMRTIGTAISDAILIQKANELKEEFPVCSNFQASTGWIAKFKKRYQIRLVHIYEKVSAGEDGANSFVHNFEKYIEEEEISLENIYNMDETSLLWKALPSRTLVPETEKNVSGHKMWKDRLTVGFCVNASGTHKIMPLVIHKYKKPRVLKDCIGQRPVIFKAQSNAWINQTLFVDWFDNHFKKSVRQYQLENRLCGKVILLLDNCSSHKFPSDYEHDDNFEVKFLPPNITSLIQPMDQGIIEKVKRCFRHSLIQSLVAFGCGINEFFKKYTINECIYMISESWEALTCSDIKNAWKNILPNTRTIKETEEDRITSAIQQAWSHISEHDVTVEDIENYFTACSEEERRLSGPLQETVAEDVHEGRTTEEVITENGHEGRATEEVVAEDGHEGRATEEVVAEDGHEGRATEEVVAEDGHEGRATEEVVAEEEEREIGLKLPLEIRRKLENAFECIKMCQNYFPRSVNCALEGLQLSIFGDTTSVNNK